MFFIDRFEGEYAIVELENSKIYKIPRTLIPDSAVEGDCLYIEINKEYNKKRKERISKLMDDIWLD